MIYLSIFTDKSIFFQMAFILIVISAIIALYFFTRKQIIGLFILALDVISTIGIFKIIFPNLYYWKISEFDKSEMYDNINSSYILTWLFICILIHFIIYSMFNYLFEKKCKNIIQSEISKFINNKKNNPEKHNKFKEVFLKKFIMGYQLGHSIKLNITNNDINGKESEIDVEQEFQLIFDKVRSIITISFHMILCCLLFIKHYVTLPIIIASILFFIFNLIAIRGIAILRIISTENQK